jgi:hypothetical protein
MTSNFTKKFFLNLVLATVITFTVQANLKAQAYATINSSTGYKVNVTLSAVSLVVPSSCPWGYNFNTKFNYNITFSGSNIPANLYTLQTYLDCGSYANFVQLPKNGGTGSVTTHSNPYNSNADCGTVTPTALDCNSFRLIIQGPGIPSQTITMSYNNTIALPVQLIGFNVEAKSSRVVMKWQTASEINSSYFAVERSTDGNNWQTVKRVESVKNSTVVQDYISADDKPVAGLSFYRLKQVDMNGEAFYSKIEVMNFQPAVVMSVYPNPATTSFSVEAENIDNSMVTIMDCTGKTLDLQNEAQQNKLTYHVNGLANGIYFVQVNIDGEVSKQTITIRN